MCVLISIIFIANYMVMSLAPPNKILIASLLSLMAVFDWTVCLRGKNVFSCSQGVAPASH